MNCQSPGIFRWIPDTAAFGRLASGPIALGSGSRDTDRDRGVVPMQGGICLWVWMARLIFGSGSRGLTARMSSGERADCSWIPRNFSALLFALVIAIAALPSFTRAQAVEIDRSKIRDFVSGAMRADAIPGLAVVVVTRNGTAFAEGFGTNRSEDEAITPDTPFVLGSMSKSMTALAVMQLVEARRIDLDAPVRIYLPDFAMASAEAEHITVRQLLAHTSGIPTHAARASGDESTLADHVAALRRVDLVRVPGAAYEYASPNYQLLGRIVEVVSGESFGTYVARHIFTPLGMRHSYVDAEPARTAGLAEGHQMMFGAVVTRELSAEPGRLPTAALMASANDLGRFMRAQLRGGELDGERVASERSMAAMHHPLVQLKSFGYAMGWRVSDIGVARAVHHGGILPTYRGKMVILPELGIGVAVLTNVSTVIGSPSSHRIADGVAAIASGQEPDPAPRWALRWILLAVAIGMALITALQLRGLFLAVRASRSFGVAAREIGFAVALIPGLPWLVGIGWIEMWRQAPDMTAWIVVAASIGVATGLLRLRGNVADREG